MRRIPRLFSALLAAIHLMLFATIVRLFSARTTRDYMFLALLAFSAMLASAILTVDTAFIGFFLVFLALCVSTFIGLEMRRGAEGAAWTPLESGTPAARRLHFALGLTSAAVAMSALVAGAVIFFLLPRFRAGYLSGFNLQPGLISGFSDEVELGEIGVIQQSNDVVMRIRVEGNPSAAETCTGAASRSPVSTGAAGSPTTAALAAIAQEGDGWILLNRRARRSRPRSTQLRYTVLLEPMASDAMFVAAEPAARFAANSRRRGHARSVPRGPTCCEDKTGSLSNPFHNFSNVRYDAVSEIPRDLGRFAAPRAAHVFRRRFARATCSFRPLDPRIPALAREIAAGQHNPLDQARCHRALSARPLFLHAGPGRARTRRSAGAFPFRNARRPLRIFRLGHDRHAARAWGFPRATSRASWAANTTTWAATSSFARGTRIAGWKPISPDTAG